jgi:hypothetical protein
VFDYLVGQHYVEHAVSVGQGLSSRYTQVWQIASNLRQFLPIDIHPVHVIAEATESANIHPYAASHIQYGAGLQGYVPAHKIEPPLLTKAPDVTGMSQSDCFFLFHRGYPIQIRGSGNDYQP